MQIKNAYSKKIKKYVNYANSHLSDISKATEHQFLLRYQMLKEEYIHRLSQVISKPVIHYELQSLDDPETPQGQLIEKGVTADLERTVADFLANEYTGEWQEPKIKGLEGYWITWGDKLNKESHKFVSETVKFGYRDVLSEAFQDDFSKIVKTPEFTVNCVLDNTTKGFAPWLGYYSPLFWRPYVEYLDLADWKLKDIIAYNDAHLTGERWS